MDEYTQKLATAAADLEPAKAALTAAEAQPGGEGIAALRQRVFNAERASTLLKARQYEHGPDYPPRKRSGHAPPA